MTSSVVRRPPSVPRAPRQPTEAELARAREAFLTEGVVDAAAVRAPILDSWTRSRERAVPVERPEVPYVEVLDPESPLARAGGRVVDELSDVLLAEPVSLVLCDAEGTVLRRLTGDRRLARTLDGVSLAPGFSYAERHVGTNGIGTALESGAPATVYGHEHFVENLEQLACAAAPVLHPLTGEVVGAVNLTCRQPDAGALLLTTVVSLARQVREALLEEAGRRERALLEQFLLACEREGRVRSGSEVVLDRASRALSGTDRRHLVERALHALALGAGDVVVDLPGGARATVGCTPSRVDDVVLSVREVRTPAHAVRAAVATGTRLAVTGEPGTGKAHLVKAARPGLRELDAADVSPAWWEAVEAALPAGLLLRRVDRLAEDARLRLAGLLAASSGWAAVTLGPLPGELSPGLAALLALLPATVEVAPLRHRPDEVPHLARALLGRPLPPDVAAALARHRWPGNVAELARVLALAPDLPSSLLAGRAAALTPLEEHEREALQVALAVHDGDKAAAGEALGLSRATVYRKVRRYGLVPLA